MTKHPDGSITNLPVIKPPTATKEFHDSLLKATSMTAEDVALLDKCLSNYLKD